MMRTFLALLAFACLVVAGARPANASDRVVVLKVEGDRSRAVEKVLKAIVKATHTVVSDSALKRAAKRVKVKKFNPRGIAKVAKKLDASAVLESELSKDGRIYVLIVRVRKPDGEIAQELTQDMKKRKPSRAEKRSLGKQVLAALNSIDVTSDAGSEPVADAGSADGVDDSAGTPKGNEDNAAAGSSGDGGGAAGAGGDLDAPAESAGDERPAGGTEVAAIDTPSDDAESPLPTPAAAATVAAAPRRTGRRDHPHGMRLEVGGSGTARTLTFNARTGFNQTPVGYPGGGLAPGARVSGEAYPLEYVMPGGFFAGLGVAAEYDQVIGLTTRTSEQESVDLKTTERRWSVGARFRYSFGGRATSPSVAIGAGYGRRTFVVDRTPLQAGNKLDLPDVDYKYVDPGLWFRMPLGWRLALSASARGLLFLDAGAIQNPEEYGAATVTGVDAEAGFEVFITRRILVHVSGAFTRIGFDFIGNGTQTNARDSEPSSQDIGGASDQYLGGHATLGVVF